MDSTRAGCRLRNKFVPAFYNPCTCTEIQQQQHVGICIQRAITSQAGWEEEEDEEEFIICSIITHFDKDDGMIIVDHILPLPVRQSVIHSVSRVKQRVNVSSGCCWLAGVAR